MVTVFWRWSSPISGFRLAGHSAGRLLDRQIRGHQRHGLGGAAGYGADELAGGVEEIRQRGTGLIRQLAENIPAEIPLFATSRISSVLLKWMAG
jgi:hypothetical protein